MNQPIDPALARILRAAEETFERGEQPDRMLTPLEKKLLRALQISQYGFEVVAKDRNPREFALRTVEYLETVISDALGRGVIEHG